MKKICFIIGVALFIAVLPALTIAQPAGVEGGQKGACKMNDGVPGGGAGPGVGMILKLKDKLGLSAEQVKQLEAIRNEVQGKLKTGAETVKAKREALQKAVESGSDEAAIRIAASALGSAIGDQSVLMAGTKAKINGVLTDEQKAKLEELKKQKNEKRQEMSGKGERRMGPNQQGQKGPGIAQNPKAAFERIDTNGDGAISLEEFKAHMEQMKERRGGKRPAPLAAPNDIN